MKLKMKKSLAILFIISLLSGCGPKYITHEAIRPPPRVQWIVVENVAKASANLSNKSLFTYYPDKKCIKEDKKLFSDTEVVVLISDSFIPFKAKSSDRGEKPRFEIKIPNGIYIPGPSGCISKTKMVRYIMVSKIIAERLGGADINGRGLY